MDDGLPSMSPLAQFRLFDWLKGLGSIGTTSKGALVQSGVAAWTLTHKKKKKGKMLNGTASSCSSLLVRSGSSAERRGIQLRDLKTETLQFQFQNEKHNWNMKIVHSLSKLRSLCQKHS